MSNSTMYSMGTGGMSVNDMGLMYIFHYVPSLSAASTLTAFYAVIVCVTMFMSNMVRLRGAGRPTTSCCLRCCFGDIKICHFTAVLPSAAILELIGYGVRRDMILHFGAWPYLISTVTLLIAPVILAIMNYKAVVRLLAAAKLHVGCLSPHAIGFVIVFVDVVCAILQFGGSVCATLAIAMHLKLIKDLADYLLLTSFILQLVLNFAFTLLCRWMHRLPQFSPQTSSVPQLGKFWTSMWISICLLWVRNLYRALEAFAFVAGSNAFAVESLFYALDTVPVLLCFMVLSWGHYGMLLPPDDDKLQLLTSLESVNGSVNDPQSPRPQSVSPAQLECSGPDAA